MPVVEGKADFPVAHSDFEFEPQTDIGAVRDARVKVPRN